jgi:hypothetical protein
VSQASSHQPSEFDPDETIQSSVQEYLTRTKHMRIEESAETTLTSEKSPPIPADITNFIKTFNLEASLGPL